jgi:myosin heavy subunit
MSKLAPINTDIKMPDASQDDTRSPTKPTGILLTPGTATARRKRVSFDRDTKAGTNGEPAKAGRPTIQERLEASRSNKAKTPTSEAKDTSQKPARPAEEESGEEWEEDFCNHDVTVDLNEPHSRSGKYWKTEFGKYTEDARAQMEQLVKYKHLAKCYAQKKDAEAMELNQKLKEEQEKVAQMELKITEMAAKMAGKQGRGSDTDNSAVLKKLAEKTALALEYRDRVKELEALLKQQEDSGAKTQRHRNETSPRTEETMFDLKRELRRARSDLRETDKLRQEVERLKPDLLFSQQRVTKLQEENKRLAAESSQPSSIQKLEKQLRDTKDESRQKDDELRTLRKEYNTLKDNAKKQLSQSLQVLDEKNERIQKLEKEVKALKESEAALNRPKSLDAALAKHTRITQDLKSDMASMNKPSIHRTANPGYPRRSTSAEDLTRDMTQSVVAEETAELLRGLPQDIWRSRRFSVDSADSMLKIEEEMKMEKQQGMDARRRDKGPVVDDPDTEQHLAKPSRVSAGSRRVMSDHVNESSPKESKQRAVTYRHTLSTSDRALMRDALDNPTATRNHSNPKSARASLTSYEPPEIDLLHDRFAKLGGPNPNDTMLTANASRCTLPADRMAAARARLEQKRRDKQRAGDKENMRPYRY